MDALYKRLPWMAEWECVNCSETHWYSKIFDKQYQYNHCGSCGEANWKLYTEVHGRIPPNKGLRM